MSLRRSLLCLGLAVAAGACTPMQWQHQSLGVSPNEAEVAECNQSAFYEANRQAFFYSFARPFHYPGRYYGRPGFGPWPSYSSSDRFFLERDLFDYCMRAKGYRLIPAPNA